MQNLEGSLIVGYSFSGKDIGVLTVGKQENGIVKVINAFSGEEAMDIFNNLITVKEKKDEES